MTNAHFPAQAVKLTPRAAFLSLAILSLSPSLLHAAEALGDTLPAPGSATSNQVFMPAAAPSPDPTANSSAVVSPPGSAPVLSNGGPSPLPAASAPIIGMAPGMGGIASSIPGTSDGLMKAPETPAAVKDAITRLQKTDNINLDDMIRAQDAINRLDLMLEIEKRQDEIKKLREGDKPKGMSSLLQGGIPASVLGLPSTKTPAFNPSGGDDFASAPVIKRTPKEVDYTVTRIIGSNGRYAAVLDNGDESVTVRSGEKLPDGRKVASINLTSVVISGGEKGSKGKTLTIPSDTYIVRGTSLTD